jgi:hypothetical protein
VCHDTRDPKPKAEENEPPAWSSERFFEVRPQEFKEPEQLRKIERTLIKHRFMGSCTAANKAVARHGVLQRGMDAATRGSLGWQHEVDPDGKRVFKAPLPKGRSRDDVSHPDAGAGASSSSASSSSASSRATSPAFTDRNSKKCAKCQKSVLLIHFAKSQRTCKACQADPAAAGV